MYYLWQNNKNKEIHYITDYKEVKEDGRVWVDGYGLVEATLIFQHEIKEKIWEYGQKQLFTDKKQ